MSAPRDLKAELRSALGADLENVMNRLNGYLEGKGLDQIEAVLQRLGRNGRLPHWYVGLRDHKALPNLDGKTVGSVVEMLLVADAEVHVLAAKKVQLRINPASGVDLPDLDLGIKSPSENWCTSEPFTHAYERLLGSEYDVLALITNYQTAKKKPPLRLQIIRSKMLTRSQVADRGLCAKARYLRSCLDFVEEPSAQKALRFLAYVNQSDWMAKVLVRAMDLLRDEKQLRAHLMESVERFPKDAARSRSDLNPEYQVRLQSALNETPLWKAVINAADDWVIESWRNTAQLPGHHDWEKFQIGALDGQLGVSFALQWRYNFGVLFKAVSEDHEDGPIEEGFA